MGTTVALCVLVWLLMGLLPVCIYRMRRGAAKWLLLILLNVGLWGSWWLQYAAIASNPAWATSSVRSGLLLAESVGSVVVLLSMMYVERARIRKRNLERLEWDR